MVKVNIILPDELYKQLRHAIIDKYGVEKGGLSKAVTEAVKLWLNEQAKLSPKK